MTLLACQTNNKELIEIGSLSILEYPDSQELQVWIASDSQYKQVFQVRKYFEDFVYEGFFDEKEIQLKFNNLTWSKMVEYQKRYSNLLNKYSDIYQDSERLNKFVDSLILTEFPEINKFTEEIFKLRFVSSEFELDGLRFDSVCFDEETISFVIIEYKKDSSFSIIDQGFAYLSTMLSHKADLILEYNETTGKTLKKNEVDWNQPRIIFISPSFTIRAYHPRLCKIVFIKVVICF